MISHTSLGLTSSLDMMAGSNIASISPSVPVDTNGSETQYSTPTEVVVENPINNISREGGKFLPPFLGPSTILMEVCGVQEDPEVKDKPVKAPPGAQSRMDRSTKVRHLKGFWGANQIERQQVDEELTAFLQVEVLFRTRSADLLPQLVSKAL